MPVQKTAASTTSDMHVLYHSILIYLLTVGHIDWRIAKMSQLHAVENFHSKMVCLDYIGMQRRRNLIVEKSKASSVIIVK